MNRILKNKNVLLCGLFPSISTSEVDMEKYKEARGLFIEDPWERVKSMFSRDEMGKLHPELQYVIDMTQIAFLGGAMYGGTIESLKKTDNFIRTNDTNIYSDKRQAYRTLSDASMAGFFKGALRWSPRFGIFLGGFTLITSCLEMYRNKPEIIDHSLAGFVVGSLDRLSFGLKGMISGGIVGGVLGTLYGTIIWLRCKLTRTENLEIKYAHFALSRSREMLKKNIKSEEETTSGESFPGTLDNFEVKQEEIKSEK